MVAFLAALPAIFATISSATDLFEVGKKVIKEVSGKNTEASTPEELFKEIDELEPEKARQFVERMKAEVEEYSVVSKRLMMQGGQVDGATLNVIPENQRGHIAMMRMTTRPWAVRWMVYAVVLPPLASVGFNLLISFYNVLNNAWGFHPRTIELIVLGDVFNDLYVTMVGWATGVIMTYMGMREIGKAVGHNDGVALKDITNSVGGVVESFKKVFK